MQVKICGLRTEATVAAAVTAGAAYIGFNFFPKSPRYVDFSRAAELSRGVPPGVAKVALSVDATDQLLDAMLGLVPIDMLQLHGSESAERVAGVKARFGLPVMKVIPVGDESDLTAIGEFARVADQIMIDAKPAPGALLPGGNGVPFDWRLIAGRRWATPWMLAGGLNAGNVAEAARLTGARQVDVSSGVEDAPGVKSVARIAAFVAAASRVV